MARLSIKQRGQAIGMLRAGSQRMVSCLLCCTRSTISRLLQKFQRNGKTNLTFEEITKGSDKCNLYHFSKHFPLCILRLVLTFQVTFKTKLDPPEVVLKPDLENNFICLILSCDPGGLQQYMRFCKLQSLLHVQHENKVLDPGLSVPGITTDLEICLYGLQNHCAGSKYPEFHGIILSH